MKRVPLIALLLAGCTTVGPDYREPQMAVPASYMEPAANGEFQLDHWWRGFGDAQLTTLVEQALEQNLDIEMAAARIREARAQEGVAGSGASPQLAAEASATRQRISENAIPAPPGSGQQGGAFGLPGSEFTTWRAGFDASWELDLFGRNRAALDAAIGAHRRSRLEPPRRRSDRRGRSRRDLFPAPHPAATDRHRGG